MIKRISLIVLSLALLFSLGLAACKAPAPTTPPPTTPSTPPPAESALEKVIEAAKKEGKVNFFCGGHNYESDKISQGIKDLFGVDIEVSVTPGRQTEVLGTIVMEVESDAPPSFDVVEMAHTNIMSVAKPKGVIADIDWEGLLAEVKGGDLEMILPPPASYPSTTSYVQTLAYNSDKVSAEDLPKTFKDVTDPKWSGKFGWMRYGIANVENLYFLDMADDSGVKYIQDIIKNKPSLDSFDALSTKLSMGELYFALLGSHEFNRIAIKDPNTPLKWAQLNDFCKVAENGLSPVKGSKNLNAATLFILYFLTPEGLAYNATTGYTHYTEPGTTEYEMVEAAKKAGMPIKYSARDAKYAEFLASPECQELLGKVDLAVKGGQTGGGGKK